MSDTCNLGQVSSFYVPTSHVMHASVFQRFGLAFTLLHTIYKATHARCFYSSPTILSKSLRSPREMLAKAAVDKAALDREARLEATSAEVKVRHAYLIQATAELKLAEDRLQDWLEYESPLQDWLDLTCALHHAQFEP